MLRCGSRSFEVENSEWPNNQLTCSPIILQTSKGRYKFCGKAEAFVGLTLAIVDGRCDGSFAESCSGLGRRVEEKKRVVTATVETRAKNPATSLAHKKLVLLES